MPQILLLTVSAALCVGLAGPGVNRTASTPPVQKESPKMSRAAGTFEVKLAPETLADAQADPLLGRMSIDKQFMGDLTGTSKGEMLAARTATDGSAGYVAIERVTGTLAGKKGSFVLQHSGTMTRGQQHLEISVVPDSGTGELLGLTGTMTIRIEGGKHFYELTYNIARP